MHTNFKGNDWKLSSAKKYDVRKELSYDDMVNNDVFRVSDDLRRNGNKHSIDLFVSPGYRYNEYDAVGDELWLVEMTAKNVAAKDRQIEAIEESLAVVVSTNTKLMEKHDNDIVSIKEEQKSSLR